MPELEIPHPPVPKARPRTVTGPDGKVHTFTPRATEVAEGRIREAWCQAFAPERAVNAPGMAERGPVYVELLVRIARPAGHYGKRGLLPSAPRWPAVRPDLDNYAKTALDALRGIAFRDDGQIVRLYVAKVYAHDGSIPGWKIGVWPMDGHNGFMDAHTVGGWTFMPRNDPRNGA